MPHIVLLGDSILDNAAYTAGGPTVRTHLQELCAATGQATLLAVDGSLTADVIQQLTQVPADATHLVVSAGGNNAIMQSDIVAKPAHSMAEAFFGLATVAHTFTHDYQQMLHAVIARKLPTIVCTIYDPNFADPTTQTLMRTGLLPFNDTIVRCAVQAQLPLIDLRFVCTTPGDYANDIEPSVQGGKKIAAAIMRAVTEHPFHTPRTAIYW